MATTSLTAVDYNPSQSIECAIIISFIFFFLLFVLLLIIIRCSISVTGDLLTYNDTQNVLLLSKLT